MSQVVQQARLVQVEQRAVVIDAKLIVRVYGEESRLGHGLLPLLALRPHNLQPRGMGSVAGRRM